MTIEIERKNFRGTPVRQPQAAVMPAGGFSDNKVVGQEARFGHKGHLFSGVPSARGCIPMSMNSGQEPSPDRPAAEDADASQNVEAADAADASEDVEAADADHVSETLQRSQDAIDEGREAAREALQNNPPEADLSEPRKPES